jgi:uncharacterized protein
MRVILDTGPLVAFLNRRDTHHRWAREIFETVAVPARTCESVISEACFRLRAVNGGPQSVLELVRDGLVSVAFHLSQEVPRIEQLMRKYADVPISLADGCLVRMSEQDLRATVLTVDSDFHRYRRNGREVIPVAMP